MVCSSAGWSIIAALTTLGSDFIRPKLSQLFALWNSILQCHNVRSFQTIQLNSMQAIPKADKELNLFVNTRADALGALAAFMGNCTALVAENVKKQIATLLHSAL